MLQTRKHINIFNLSSSKKGVSEREREREGGVSTRNADLQTSMTIKHAM